MAAAISDQAVAKRPRHAAPFRGRPSGLLHQPRLPKCPEIDCVRGRLSYWAVVMAELRAAEIGVGADRVLIAEGHLSEDDYVAALATELGIARVPLDTIGRHQCPLTDDDLIQAAVAGQLPLRAADGVVLAIAPRRVNSRLLVSAIKAHPSIASRVRLVTAAQLQTFVSRHSAGVIGYRAAEKLRTTQPELSAGSVRSSTFGRRAILAGAALTAVAAWVASHYALAALEFIMGTIFLAWTALRLFSTIDQPVRRTPLRAPLTDDRLPIYTVIVALYREEAAATELVAALEGLNYPAEKLDIKLVLEADDHETCAAMARLHLKPHFEIVIAPERGPRTKPKALNAALPFARGEFTAVFDAEDRPAPGQLRLALEAFAAGGHLLACAQARLTIDNSTDSWLARMFTAEYAGLFDVLLPSLAAWRLPLPLGGSSNHFRTNVLRRVGGWDPYNVTEDADLGMRLARLGYRTGVIASTTYEEAPARFGPWLRQRTRWFKGWMQTWQVHMRAPVQAFRELGFAGFVVFQLLVGGAALAALVHVLFAAGIGWTIVSSQLNGTESHSLIGFYATTLVVGYLASALLALVGLARRKLLSCAWALILIPVYWLLLSLAAWRALFQLLRDPYRWEKTEHGLARTSRLAQRIRAGRAAIWRGR